MMEDLSAETRTMHYIRLGHSLEMGLDVATGYISPTCRHHCNFYVTFIPLSRLPKKSCQSSTATLYLVDCNPYCQLV
jgi:hypothetical protein